MASQPPLNSIYQQDTVLKLHMLDSNLSPLKFTSVVKAEASTAQESPLHQRSDVAYLEEDLLENLSSILEPNDLVIARLLLKRHDTHTAASANVTQSDVQTQVDGVANMRISSPPRTPVTRRIDPAVAARFKNVLSTLITAVQSYAIPELKRLRATICENEQTSVANREAQLDTTITQASMKIEEPAATITAQIQNLFRPLTMSAIMKVLIEGLSEPAVLKLFDRRYSSKVRTTESSLPWSKERESAYHDFVRSGEAEKFTHWFNNESSDASSATNSDSSWTTSHEETFLQGKCHDLYTTELAAYHALSTLQGHCVPKLLATVTFQPFPTASQDIQKFTVVHGLLLSYIPGFTLDQLPQHVPQLQWPGICDDAVRAVNACADLGVLKPEMRARNCIVQRVVEADGAGHVTTYRPFIVGFEMMRLRGEGESEEEWARRKSEVSGEVAMGGAMMRELEWEFREGRHDYERAERYHGAGDQVRGEVLAGSSLVWDGMVSEDSNVSHEEVFFLERGGSPVYPRAFLVDTHDDIDSDEGDLVIEGGSTDADGGFSRAYPLLSRSDVQALGIHAPE